MNTFLIVLMVAAIGYLAFGLKIANESERFAETVLGRYTRLLGPGLLLKLGGAVKKWTKISLGQEGRFLGDGRAEFSGSAVPVESERISVGNNVIIESFRDGKIWVIDRGAGYRMVVCEKCGHATKAPA